MDLLAYCERVFATLDGLNHLRMSRFFQTLEHILRNRISLYGIIPLRRDLRCDFIEHRIVLALKLAHALPLRLGSSYIGELFSLLPSRGMSRQLRRSLVN